ncbi:hypothetical protein [Demequina zhanjiangensis]|uniref:ABC transporter permease n=1 Tax=Demequina zhanjiangensis TaxID=3051659 RepID=A0ABT8G1X4_9MICO|nr:hypothetical protein [Demequina sp. SYSU T00b26]MDN4472944.1 hypothetical protein [Demequina sp. SYSU T00b26]
MTAIETSPAAAVGYPATPLAHRLRAVLRIHFANPFMTLIQPWLITLLIFGVNLAIYGLIAYAAGGADRVEEGAFQNNGGVSWVFVFMIVIAVQAMHFTFRFALGMSVARRDYYVGTLGYFGILALVHSLGLTVFAVIERATGGWWMDAAFFAPLGLAGQPVPVVTYLYVVGFLLALSTGAFAAGVWVRWASNGLYVYFATLLVAVVAFLWVVTTSHAWGDVWSFLTGTSIPTLATWALLVVAVSAGAGFALIRRAPVRS